VITVACVATDVPVNVPTPRQLFHQLDAGQISRADFQAAMAEHAKELIEQMDEVHRNPFAAYLDEIHNRAAAFALTFRHGERLVREVLNALADLPDFPPARWFWNALHMHVPLHCFFRTKSEPVFRILKLDAQPQIITLSVEYGKGVPQRLEIRLRRLRNGQMIEEWRR